ncbi:hypothetical protein D3C73_971140 [compost metagenome]
MREIDINRMMVQMGISSTQYEQWKVDCESVSPDTKFIIISEKFTLDPKITELVTSFAH